MKTVRLARVRVLWLLSAILDPCGNHFALLAFSTQSGLIHTITLWPPPENCVNTSHRPSGEQFEHFTTALGCSIRVSRRSSLPSRLAMTIPRWGIGSALEYQSNEASLPSGEWAGVT